MINLERAHRIHVAMDEAGERFHQAVAPYLATAYETGDWITYHAQTRSIIDAFIEECRAINRREFADEKPLQGTLL